MMLQKFWRGLVLALILITGVSAAAAARAPALVLTPDQQAAVNRIAAYLNSYQSLRGEFSQVSPKGILTTGTLYIQKPGKLRFDYANNPLLIIADGRWLTIEDRTRKRGDQFPLSATPMRLVVNPQIDLLAETDVIAFDQRDGLTTISLQDKKDNLAGGGFITLIYDEQLQQLRQWTVVDSKDRRTTVQLSNLEFGGKFDAKLFEVGELNKDKP